MEEGRRRLVLAWIKGWSQQVGSENDHLGHIYLLKNRGGSLPPFDCTKIGDVHVPIYLRAGSLAPIDIDDNKTDLILASVDELYILEIDDGVSSLKPLCRIPLPRVTQI